MEQVDFREWAKGKRLRGWTFALTYPGKLSQEDTSEEIWLTKERLRIPVGIKKVSIYFFLWIQKEEGKETYSVSLGMVPSSESLDEVSIKILKKRTKNKFYTHPYYYLLHEKGFSSTFLIQTGIEEEELDEVFIEAQRAMMLVEKNLIYYLEGGENREFDVGDGEGNARIDDNGWGVLIRARSGSI